MKPARSSTGPNDAQMAIRHDLLYNGYISGGDAWGQFTKLGKSALDCIVSLDEGRKKSLWNKNLISGLLYRLDSLPSRRLS
jgi:hypothetical protein